MDPDKMKILEWPHSPHLKITENLWISNVPFEQGGVCQEEWGNFKDS